MIHRRQALLTTLFGAGYMGLRAIATGVPASLLLDPRRLLAAPPPPNPSARFIVFQTSGDGDPINANCPGTYDDAGGSAMTSGIAHGADPSMARTPLSLGGATWGAALPWAQPWLAVPNVITPGVWQAVLDRTTFWHLATATPIHPKEPNVLKLMDQTQSDDMLPSILARYLAPALGTIQAQPIAIGARSPSEALTYGGQTQPLIPPTAIKATLASPAGPLSSLQALRDQTMNALYAVYKTGATAAQQASIDALVTSQQQARAIGQSLLGMLDSIADDGVASQITAALALIQMKVTPVVSIHVPFGGDNHVDPDLVIEAQQTAGVGPNGALGADLTGVPAIAALMSAVYAAQLQDAVAFMSLNVFGRTLAAATGAGTGRQHNPNHHVAITIGGAFRPGVVGGVAPFAGAAGDYGAVAIDSTTGIGSPGGDIAPAASLASWGKTMMAGVGIDGATIAREVVAGTVIAGALSG
jgi:hypothetical protein